MPAEITLPVYIRVGNYPEAHFGEVTIPVTSEEGSLFATRREMAAFLRAAADEIEHPTPEQEDTADAPAHR